MDWMIRRHFYEEDKPEQPVHISYQRILNFIREAAKYVISKLTEAGSPLCMLSE
jgi:hypothetical protein